MDPTRLQKLLTRAVPAACVALLVTAVPASAGILFPEAGGGSPGAEDIRTLYAIIFVLGFIVFVGVEGVLIWCLVKYRAKRGRVAAQIHGNTKLEIGWTVGAAVILVFLTIATFVMLPGIKNPAASDIDINGNPIASNAAFASTDQRKPPEGQALNIQVNGKQYVWQFTYPGDEGVFSYTRMYVPVGMTVTLDIESDDVQHSWWIPELGGKMDALPGYTNKTWFKVTEPGTYSGQCAELCGRNHANMYAEVVALPFEEWRQWYDDEAQEIADAKEYAAQERERLEQAEGEDATQGTSGASNTNTNPAE
ncbi:MAG TPA: cytochrome c oxidase subunit II [Solirubrobacteraceae bacterium]|jgi:cytochrome c oxidase subunit II|nr:cytochrome c oxidase subunit II [Solirubrobacteraceae bacterium]